MKIILYKCLSSGPLPFIRFVFKSLILIGYQGNKKLIFENKMLKNLRIRSHKLMKPILGMNGYDIFSSFLLYDER